MIGSNKTDIKPQKNSVLLIDIMITKNTLTIAFYILSYFTISIGLGFFSSYFLSSKNYNFRFPLFITSMQNLIHFILSNLVMLFMRKNLTRIDKKSIRRYFMTTLPCAISAALDIGIGSYALRTVSLAYYTMIKSSSPVFVLLCGFIFGVETPSIKLFLVVFIIGIGVFLTTIKTETSHIKLCLSKTTFMLLFASFMGGFRWAFIQFIMQKNPKKNNMKHTTNIERTMNNKSTTDLEVSNIQKTVYNQEQHIINENKQTNDAGLQQPNKIDFYKINKTKTNAKSQTTFGEKVDTQKKTKSDRLEFKIDHIKNRSTCKKGQITLPGQICQSKISNQPFDLENNNLKVIATIHSLCIPIGCFLFLFSCVFEGINTIFTSEFFRSSHSIKINAGYILLTGVLTFILLVSEFLLVSKTSVIFLSVCGIVKELMIVFISVCRRDIIFEATNYVGLGVSIFGMILYNYMRIKNKLN